jgi:hypothetical protein
MNFVYAVLASIIFSFYDYFGYNVIALKGQYKGRLYFYRVTQALVGALLLYALFDISTRAALAALVIYFTFGDDFLYYAFCNLGWYGLTGKVFKEQILGNQCTWAWGTPFGLITWAITKVRKSVISGDLLCLQAAIGLFVALAISKAI